MRTTTFTNRKTRTEYPTPHTPTLPHLHSLLSAKKLTREEVYCGLLPGFESEAIATQRSHLLCTRLDKGGEQHKALKRRICKCRADEPCGSGACPVCLRAARMHLVPQVGDNLHRMTKWIKKDALGLLRLQLWSVSAVDYRMAVPLGSLDAKAVRNKSEAVAKHLHRHLPNSSAIAGVDIGLNFPLPKGSAPHWQPQLYFLIFAASEKQLHATLDPLFPQKPGTEEKPVHVRRLLNKNIASAGTYTFKSVFTRRVSYLGRNGRMQTRKVSLKPGEAAELALFLDQLGIKGRLLLHGFKIIKGRLFKLQVSAALIKNRQKVGPRRLFDASTAANG